MNQLVTTGIILARVDYGEADRILTLLTPDHGKLRLLARGVRRVKSKLAGGIELFSVSHLTYIAGKNGGMGTLVSTRLEAHYGHIVEELERTMLGYDLIKQLNRQTEDAPEPAYFELLHASFVALNQSQIPLQIIRLWFAAQLLRLQGHGPNLLSDTSGHPLDASLRYNFSFEQMAFAPAGEQGRFTAQHIKFLRLCFGEYSPGTLAHIAGGTALAEACAPLVQGLVAHV